MKFASFIFLMSLATASWAFDNPYFMRSPQALLMGDAFTAVNDDDFTLFYNPASLGRRRRDFTLYPLNGQFKGSNIMGDMDRFENLPNDPVGLSRVLMDYPAHASAGVAPGFKLFNVGVTFLANESYDVLLRNRAYPMMDIDLRSDRGVLLGVGIPIGPSRLGRRSVYGSQTSLGLGVKYIERTGLRDTLALAGPVVTDSIGRDKLNDLLKGLGRVRGIGWGFDAGLEHVVRSGNTQYIMGLAALDITGTDFKVAKNPDNLQVASNRDQINLGLAMGQDYKIFNYVFSADIRSLNEEMDFGKRMRFGAQVGIPGLKFMGGINSGYYSYGATVDLAFMRLTGGFYDIEVGSKYKQLKSRRFVLYLSLFDFSFDA
jgi:hypothetical protein